MNFQTRDSVPTLFTLNYGVRFAHWDFNGESLFSPRASLTITPGRNRNLSFRIAGGMDIEQVAKETPEKIEKIVIDPVIGMSDYLAREASFSVKSL